MKKRWIAFLLAAVMTFGMLPLNALPTRADEVDSAYLAAYSSDVTLDGSLSELSWNMAGVISDENGQKFGAIWTKDDLYLAVTPVGAAELSVKLNGKTIQVTSADGGTATGVDGVRVKWASAVEICIPMASLDVVVTDFSQKIPAEITVSGAQWSGDLVLSATEWTKKANLGGGTGVAGDGDGKNVSVTVNGDAITFANKYSAEADEKGNQNDGTRGYWLMGNVNEVNTAKNFVIEFDFQAHKMPEIYASYVAEIYACYGLSFSAVNGKGETFCVGIANQADGMWLSVNGLPGGVNHRTEKIFDKKLGDKFHLRFEATAEDDLLVYVDGVLLRSFDDVMVPSKWGSSTNFVTFNQWSGSTAHLTADGKNDVEMTLSNIRLGISDGVSLLDAVTMDTIIGTNTSADAIVGNMNLPTTVPSEKIPNVGLVWTSSNESVISSQGIVTAQSEDTQVTLTAALAADPGVTKNFTVTVPKITVKANVLESEVVIDGVMSESVWPAAQPFKIRSGSTNGAVSVLWGKGYAYLAIPYENADTMTLTLGEKTWELELTDTISAEGITGVAKNGVAELKVDLSVAGVTLTDYNQVAPLNIVLSDSANSGHSAALEEEPLLLVFTGTLTQSIDLNTTQATVNGFIQADGKLTVNAGAAKNDRNYWIYPNISELDHKEDLTLVQTLEFVDLPENAAPFTLGLQNYGYTIFLGDTDLESNNFAAALIYNSGAGKLKLRVLTSNSFNDGTDLDLGKSLGDEFVLKLKWGKDESVEVFVGDTSIGKVENASFTASQSAWGKNMIALNSGGKVGEETEFKVSNIALTVANAGENSNIAFTGSPTTCPMDTYVNDNGTLTLNTSETERKYYLYTMTKDQLDHDNYDILWEQNLKIDKLPQSNYTATENGVSLSNAGVNAYGLSMTMGGVIAGGNDNPGVMTVLIKDGSALKLFVAQDDGANKANSDKGVLVELGKTLGDQFKLGIRWNMDDTVAVYVDGALKGTVQNATLKKNTGTGKDYYLGYDGCSVSTDAERKYTISDITVTQTKPAVSTLHLTEKSGPSKTGQYTLSGNVISYTGNDTSRVYFAHKLTIADINHEAYDILWEQTMYVEALPKCNYTSTAAGVNYPDGGLSAYGIPISTGMYSTTPKAMLTDLVKDSDDSLKLYVAQDDGNASTRNTNNGQLVDLGKNLKESFKLGIRWNKNGSVAVYVDDVLKGTVDNADILSTGSSADYWTGYDGRSSTQQVADKRTFTITDPVIYQFDPDSTKVQKLTGTGMVSDGGMFAVSNGVVTLKSNDTDKKYYGYTGQTAGDSAYDLLLEEDLVVTKLPVGNVQADGNSYKIVGTDGYNAHGLSMYMGRSDNQTLYHLLYKDTNGDLNLYIGKGVYSTGVVVALGKNITNTAASFKLGILWKTNNKIEVYVDGELKQTVDYQSYTEGYFKGKYLWYSGAPSSNGARELTMSNITVSQQVPAGDTVALNMNTSDILASGFTKQDGFTTLTEPTTNKRLYWITSNVPGLDHSRTITMSQTLKIDQLPVWDSTANVGWEKAAYTFVVGDITLADGGSVAGGFIYHNGDGKLKLRVITSNNLCDGVDMDLGKNLGDTFNLQMVWQADESVQILADGAFVGSVRNATFTVGKSWGNDIVSLNTGTQAGAKTKLTVSDVYVVSGLYNTLADELNYSKILGNTSLDQLTNSSRLVLPAKVQSNLGEVELTWTSDSDAIVLTKTAEGYVATITQPNSKVNAYVALSVRAFGKELWSVEAEVKALQEVGEQTAAIMDVPFTAEAVVIDGRTEDEGWTLNTKILAGGVSTGRFGAQWDMQNLYLAIEAKNGTPAITVNSKTIDPATATSANGVYEFSISLEDLGIEIKDYMLNIPAEITLGNAQWKGTLVLTSNDLFATDSTAPKMPKAATGHALATNNKGIAVVSTDTGWHFYNRYDANSDNPSLIRTYLLFNGDDVYAKLNDNTLANWCEFNFKATAMPVYPIGASTAGWSNLFACYGFNWSMSRAADDEKYSSLVSMGIFNQGDHLTFVVLKAENAVEYIPLDKQVGDEFRIATRWEPDGKLVIYIDGVKIATVAEAEYVAKAYGNNSLVMNMYRNNQVVTSKKDNIEIYIDNLALGKGYGESIMDALTVESILQGDAETGINTDPYAVTADLKLPDSLTNAQTGLNVQLQWTSSDEAVVDPVTGKVTMPENKGELVTLVATDKDESSRSKTFQIYVKAKNPESNILVAENDISTANGAGVVMDVYQFVLDTTNNSIILDQGESKAFNVITLTDGDKTNRLNESVLTIWVSDDNVTYTQVEGGFKMLRSGNKTYLYDFRAEGRFVKVHCAHYLGTEADFAGPLEDMIQVSWQDVFGAEGSFAVEKTVTVANTKDHASYDDAWTIAKSDAGVVDSDASIRIYMDDELLYHYVDGENIVVRIPKIAVGGTVTLKVLSGNDDAMDISNREYVYEVVYGTREVAYTDYVNRYTTTLADGVLICASKEGYAKSYDNGMTWTELVEIPEVFAKEDEEHDWISDPSGLMYDPEFGENGRIIFMGYSYGQFVNTDKNQSYCITNFVYSDDLGETWHRSAPVETIGETTGYYLSYSDPVKVSSYDGEAGAGVDYVAPVGAQYDNNGRLCARVIYTTDAGLTWTMGEEIQFEGEGIIYMEGGLSEGTILENENRELVLIVRCQYDSVNNFARAVSRDFGKTWSKPELTKIYTPNTQPIMYQLGDSSLLFWGGNNVLGGNSYLRFPLCVAAGDAELKTFGNIQDLYSRLSLQSLGGNGINKLMNQKVTAVDDTVIVTWSNNNSHHLVMRVDDFTNYLYRTKGAYDSFENTSVKYEGWSVVLGNADVSDEQKTEGNYAMKIDGDSNVVRSIPYFQAGQISFDLYLEELDGTILLEFESAYSDVFGEATPVALEITNGKLADLQLKEGWNHIVFDMDLPAGKASVTVDGNTTQLDVNTEIGDYICYVDITNSSAICYMDAFTVIDADPVTNSEDTEDETPKVEMVSPSLNGTIWVNYYMTIPEKIKNDETAYMEITKTGSAEPQKIYVKDLEKVTYEGKQYYKITCDAGVPAKEMTEQVVAKFYCKGEVLTEMTFSIKDYAEYVQQTSNDEKLKALVTAMLQYGAYAQLHFEHNTGNLANAGLDDYTSKLETVTAATLSEYVKDDIQNNDQVKLKSVSLLLKAETTMRLFFELADGVNIDDVTFNGEPYTGERGGLYYVDITNIAAKNLDEDVVVYINVNGQSVGQVSYSPVRYCHSILTTSNDADLVNAVKALYLYNQAANNYFN